MRLSPLGLLSLACLGSRAYDDKQHVPWLRHADHRIVSPALFTELEELARIVDIAYCVGSTSWGISKPFSCLSRCKDFPDFELLTTWNTGPLLSDSCGYIALDHGKQRIIVAFRGTYSIANTIVDLSTVPQQYVPYPGDDDSDEPSQSAAHEPKCTNCTVHMGFHSSWLNTRKQILPELQAQLFVHPTYQLTLVGHSLGGAVAALAGLDLLARGFDPVITTFGEPRAGNTGLVQYIDERFNLTQSTPEDDTKTRYRRLTHVDDPVPQLPLTEWGYAMHGGEIYISKSDLSPDLVDLQHCKGDNDKDCIAGQDSTLLATVQDEIHDLTTEPWGIPSRYKLWQLFFAHRDYFWRLGLCVPGGDPLGGGGKYGADHEDL
ncbi:Putative fungal lipase-like domain, alpha/Beta hydrolase [Septoria linicola]|uniref:Fungal lipase-like domain, alpha/Beta hydrolase n=1 Tax=Septoria linicola TaxID=215465 RepID=A0A9Q9EQM1_9PEZI|nr:putative fungal lipase-like domain, alpha/Beta hydrolase [Septoria linicola]USW57693.1 Putative fungal lipase-like domain, alpha/Beta hydrolase [Septoria linicola]